jgi:hypothetical protein
LPLRLCWFCALAVLFASPTPAYSMPSGPKAIRPPSWMVARASPLRTTCWFCGASSRNRAIRLSEAVVK